VADLDPLAHRIAFRAIPSALVVRAAGCEQVALYASVSDEAPALRLAERWSALGKSLCLPCVVDRLGTMIFRTWSKGDLLRRGLFGIEEPVADSPEVAPDLIVAPLVGFDRRMNRLGQGGGYYDRIFARYPAAVRVGLAWSVQELPSVPADPWDLPLHFILTETELIEGAL
jgi:5-formyltetrahydrofolate cyclo-ligase